MWKLFFVLETIFSSESMEMYVVDCPSCGGSILIARNELNCRIFRHAVFKDGGQVNPHCKRAEMEGYIAADRIYGCGAPFRMVGDPPVVAPGSYDD